MTRIDYSQATYSLSAHYRHQWPEDKGNEVAFAGRSNVGKSSAINAITRRKALARTSKTPGRTQQIVFFEIDPDNRLVDLPGYGYAKAPLSLRQHWEQFLTQYLDQRQCLKGLCIPMDIRRPLTELDYTMLNWCQQLQLEVHILLTKADKFKRGKAAGVLLSVQRELEYRPRCSVQLFSATTRLGVEQARARLDELYS